MAVRTFNRPWSRRRQNRRDRAIFGPGYKVASSDGIINDAYRALGIQGDGRTVPDSSYGLWRSSTNLMKVGGTEGGVTTDWSITGSGSIAVSSTEFKFGAKSLQATDSSGGADLTYSESAVGIAIAANTTYTFSVWIKANAGDQFRPDIRFNVSGAVTGSTKTLVAGWNRISITATSGASDTVASLNIHSIQAGTYYVDGVQLEQQPFATPYIETNGATASRTVGFVKAPNRVLNGSQSWAAFRVRPGFNSSVTGSTNCYLLSLGTISQEALYYNFSSGQFFFGSALASATVSASFSAGDSITVIIKWTASDSSISFNGGPFATINVANTFTISNPHIGSASTENNLWDGEVLWAAMGTGTLSDSDAATIHAKGDTDDPTNWPSLSAATMFWAANNDEWVVPTLASGATYTESATIASSAMPSGTDTAATLEAATISNITTPSATEIAQYVESATISGTTSVSSAEVHEIPDSSTVSGKTTITTNDTAQYVDTATLATKTAPSGTEVIPTDSGLPVGTTTVTSTEVANYVDAGTPISATSLLTSELHEIPDSGTITGTTVILSSDVADFVNVATLTGITSISTSDLAGTVDSTTAFVSTVPSSSDIAQYADSSTISSITTPISNETLVTPGIDAAIIPTTTLVTYSEFADYVDQAAISGVTTLNYTEGQSAAAVDSNTVNSTTVGSSSDIANYIDSANCGSTSSLTSVEQDAFVDARSINGITSVNSNEAHGTTQIDSSTAAGITSLTYTELVNYAEAATAQSGTTVQTSEEIASYIDASTSATTTMVLSSETYISNQEDAATITSTTHVITGLEGIFVLSELVVVAAFNRWTSTSTLESRWPVRSFTQRWRVGGNNTRWSVPSSVRKWATWIS